MSNFEDELREFNNPSLKNEKFKNEQSSIKTVESLGKLNKFDFDKFDKESEIIHKRIHNQAKFIHIFFGGILLILVLAIILIKLFGGDLNAEYVG
jgi:uncharacterized membrane protein YukC